MEAIVIADGSRPSFALQDNSLEKGDPFIKDWSGALATSGDAMERIAAAVGRIQPFGGNDQVYLGTGTLIDRDKGLVLTNFHVADDAENKLHIAMQHEPDRIVVKGGLEIDFDGESGSKKTKRFRIVEIRVPKGAGRVFSGIDAAVCRIEPMDDIELPKAVRVLSPADEYTKDNRLSLAVIGFPGPPAQDKGDKVNWNFVIRELFDSRFGIKRMAPGRFIQGLGSHKLDKKARRAIGHDATTFGGASGSLVAAWLDADAPCFALHFGGETVESNYALSFARVQKQLEAIGVPFA